MEKQIGRPEARKPVQIGSSLLGGARPLICVAVAACDFAGALSAVEQAATAECDLLEIRLDYIDDLNPDGVRPLLERLRGITKLPFIVTNRSSREGGAGSLPEEVRIASLIEAIDGGADAVDVELSTSPPLRNQIIQQACCRSVPVIVSFPDFFGTPASNRLVEIVKEEIAVGGNVAKFAVMIRTPGDALTATLADGQLDLTVAARRSA